MTITLPSGLTLPDVTLSANGYYAETGIHARPVVATSIESINEEIASLLALREFFASNGDLLHLYKTRDEVAEQLFNRKYHNCSSDSQAAINRIIKAEGLANV